MSEGFSATSFRFPGQTDKYIGKVREVYYFGDKLVMIATDRLSAFDVVMPRPIPYKGQVLNQIAEYFLAATEDIVPNWVIEVPDPNVTLGWRCDPFPVEMIVRGYLAGHAWRVYKSGKRTLCGHDLPDGLQENSRLPKPIVTPTTKATEGHDEDISRDEIIEQGIVSEVHFDQLERYALALYQRGTEMAAEKGLILVDTKYEFGLRNGKITLIDEIHTPDSSRYFYADTYEELLAADRPQKQLSKEFVREWLMDHDFQGKEGQTIPDMSSDFIDSVAGRYIELYEKVTGKKFNRAPQKNILKRIEENIINVVK